MGSHFIRHMLGKYPRYSVINFDTLTYAGNLENLRDVESRFPSRYKFIRGDITDKKAVFSAVKGADAIINFAAESHVDRSLVDIKPFIQTQLIGTHTLLFAAKEFGIRRFVQISTDEVYGSRLKGSFREGDPLNPSNPYAVSKAAADSLALAHGKTWNIPVLVTRSTNNYGPNQYPEKVIPLFITNIVEGRCVPLYGSGEHIREWIYVLDHAEAVDMVLHRGEAGEIYNIGSAARISNRKLALMLLNFFGKGKDCIEQVADRPGHDARYALSLKKIHTLGWRSKRTFADALKSTIEWYIENTDWWKRIKSGEYRKYYKINYERRGQTFSRS